MAVGETEVPGKAEATGDVRSWRKLAFYVSIVIISGKGGI